jgi:hypothetical protein
MKLEPEGLPLVLGRNAEKSPTRMCASGTITFVNPGGKMSRTPS